MTKAKPKPKAKAQWAHRFAGEAVVPAVDLVANPHNFRKHPKAQRKAMTAALDTVGWIQRVIVNRTTGHVVDGHLRVEEAAARGEDVPVVYVELTEDEERAALLTFDPLGALAQQDNTILDELLADHRALDLDVGRDALIDALYTAVPKDGLTDPDDVPDAPKKPKTKPGDLWALGDHRLLCGDSTEDADIARLMDGERADMVWTDPPYGVNVSGAGGDPIAGDISFTAIPLFFASLDAVLADDAWVYVCGGGANVPLYSKMFEKYFRALPKIIIWDKGRTAVMRANGYHSCYEFIFWAFKKGSGDRWLGPRDSDHADDIWRFRAPGKEREHITQKPTELPARAIGNSCPEGGIVYDPFVGAGGAIIAAERLGRRCYAMEIDPKYVDVCIRRWEEFTGQKAKRLK